MSDIYERDGVLFMNLKKNASTSSRQAFKGKMIYSDGVQHTPWCNFKIGCAGTFVRDPATRLVSVWKNLVIVKNPKDFYQPLGKSMGLEFNDPFETFLDKVLSTPMNDRDHHVRSQFDQLQDCKQMLGYDVPWFIGTFENIWEDWQRWRKFVQRWSTLCLPKEMPHTNRGKVATYWEMDVGYDWRRRVHDEYQLDYALWENAIVENR